VRVACPDGLRPLLESHTRGWQSRQQAKVEVVRERAEADIWVLPAAELPRHAAAGELEPVPAGLTEGDFGRMDLLNLYGNKLLVWDGTTYALPLVGDAPVCCYRADLLADTTHQVAFQKKYRRPLAPPVTWQDFEQIAGYFAEAAPPGLKHALPPLPADDTGLRREFYTLAACYAARAAEKFTTEDVFAFHYDPLTGKPRIDSPGFVRALELLRRLQKYRPAGTGSPEQGFAEGEGVFCLTQAWALGLFQQRGSKVYDKVAVCRMPGGECSYGTTGLATLAGPGGNAVPYLGSGAWLMAVPRTAGQPAAAFSLLADLSGPDTSGQILLDVQPAGRWAGGAIRGEQLEERTRWDAFDLTRPRTVALKDALRQTLRHPNLINPALCLRTPDQDVREKELAVQLRAALRPDGDPAGALKAVAQEWARGDPTRTRADYRRSLGLLAK
jgi:multiple sugar transport system substrate-binding protein